MESIALFKLIGEGANYAALVALWLVWRIDRRISHIEDWVKHHESTTDLRLKMMEKDITRGLDSLRERLDKESKHA